MCCVPRTAVFIQNNSLEGPGTLGDLFKRDGLDATVVGADQKIPRSADGPVVVLGGPQSANDDSPRLRAQERLIVDCAARGVPVLGICLGSQLAAKALGGSVHVGRTPEVGFYDDVSPERGSVMFSGAPDPYWVFHWHQDTFELPPGAARLASSPSYRNQAFVCGSVVGLQFHLEVDADVIRRWSAALAGQPWADPRNMDEPEAHLPAVGRNMDSFYSGFKHAFKL